jgi:glutathionyl-hydroquinone reductase
MDPDKMDSEFSKAAGKDFLTPAELADKLGVSVSTIYKKKSKGVYKEGTHYVYFPGISDPRYIWAAFEAAAKGQQITPAHRYPAQEKKAKRAVRLIQGYLEKEKDNGKS